MLYIVGIMHFINDLPAII